MNATFLGIAAAAMMVGVPAVAQTPGKITTGTHTQDAPTPGQPATPSSAGDQTPGTITTGTHTQDSTTPGPMHAARQGTMGSGADTHAASGDSNQAVATTSANAPTPAHGANSFTQGQAKSRMESEGFSNVTNLKKDDNGVWRGQADRSGSQVFVWLDYKGNVGTDNAMNSSDGTGLTRSITR